MSSVKTVVQPETASAGPGHFFAVDRRTWARACAAGMNAAVAYLVLARGSGASQRTSGWSVHAIEKYTGISRSRGQAAIDALVQAGLVQMQKTTRRPRYWILPACEVPGCEGYVPALDEGERFVLQALEAGTLKVTSQSLNKLGGCSTKEIVHTLETKGRVLWLGGNTYVVNPPPDIEPDWIWLPNALIDGVPNNRTAPVELLRQAGDAGALRLFIDLYHAHMLHEDGGIHWSKICIPFTRVGPVKCGLYTVFGFKEGTVISWSSTLFVKPCMTDKSIPQPHGKGTRDEGCPSFWRAHHILRDLGLIEYVTHVVESAAANAEVIHPYALNNGEPAERALAEAAHAAAIRLLNRSRKPCLIKAAAFARFPSGTT